MEEKTIVDWEMKKIGLASQSTKTKPPTNTVESSFADSSRVDDGPNWTFVDSTEVGYGPID